MAPGLSAAEAGQVVACFDMVKADLDTHGLGFYNM